MIFFFQAEDGIRDTSVTGVQTCALPILLKKALALYLANGNRDCVAEMMGLPRAQVRELFAEIANKIGEHVLNGRKGARRSEERRVGKECRAGRGADQCNKIRERVDSREE